MYVTGRAHSAVDTKHWTSTTLHSVPSHMRCISYHYCLMLNEKIFSSSQLMLKRVTKDSSVVDI